MYHAHTAASRAIEIHSGSELSFPVRYLLGVVLRLLYRAQVCVAVHPVIGRAHRSGRAYMQDAPPRVKTGIIFHVLLFLPNTASESGENKYDIAVVLI